MAREKEPEEFQDIPSWLMTFSDVITLLMTFFILLLTFATSEPESFDRMQVSLFGGGGSDGLVGKKDTSMDQDSVVYRERPRSGRITMRGSEMPPIHSDPSMESIGTGLKGLEQDEQRELSTRHVMRIPLAWLLDSSGDVTTLGQQQLRMIARQLKTSELELQFLVANVDILNQAVTLASHMYESESVLPGKLAVGCSSTQDESVLTLVLTRPLAGQSNGA